MGAFRLVLSLLALLFVMACGGIFADIDQEFSENQDDCDDPEELLGQVCGPCDLDTYVCLDGEVQCSGETPCSLDATTLTVEATPEAIHLSWEPVEGATAYRVIRDGVLLIEVTNPSYTDTAADPPGSPGPPQDLEATVDLEEAVILTWDAPLIDDGADHVYQVAPFESGGGGPLSDPVTASRPAPPLEYELAVDDDLETWLEVETADGDLSFEVPADLLPDPFVGVSLEAVVSWASSAGPLSTTATPMLLSLAVTTSVGLSGWATIPARSALAPLCHR